MKKKFFIIVDVQHSNKVTLIYNLSKLMLVQNITI